MRLALVRALLVVLAGAPPLLCTACAEEHPSTEPPLSVRVVGSNYKWHTRYPGADGILGTDDDPISTGPLVVPASTRVTVEFASEDFIYTWMISTRDIRQNAVPGYPTSGVFDSGPPGRLQLRGDQMCGYSHPELSGWVAVLALKDWRDWLARLPRASTWRADDGA